MTTITRENAEIKSFITGFLSDPAHDNQSSNSLLTNVFRIALASLEAEPVVYMWDSERKDIDAPGYYRTEHLVFAESSVKQWGGRVVPLYTAPPATVVPEFETWFNSQESGRSICSTQIRRSLQEISWNACCAAMLQGSQPVSQTYKFPVNTPCQDAPAHIWLQTAGVWPEDGELSELTWCSHNQHHDDTLYVRADLVNGNYPATPDSWISCSERMPDSKTAVLVAREFGGKGDWRMKWATYIPGHPDANDGWIIPGASWKPSHWMPLPEPPQEVNRG